MLLRLKERKQKHQDQFSHKTGFGIFPLMNAVICVIKRMHTVPCVFRSLALIKDLP